MTETSDPPDPSVPPETSASHDWADVYRTDRHRLIRLATVLVGPSHASDLVADAVAVAVTSTAWAGVRDPGAYLTRSVVNAAHGHHRSEGRRRDRERRATRLRVVAEGSSPGDRADDVAQTIDVHTALEGLSAQQRAVVHLHYWDDLTIPRTAEVLGVSEGTVRSHLARAKTKLQEALR